MRLAEERTAGQQRGELATSMTGRPKSIPDGNALPTINDIGLTAKDVFEGRRLLAAEAIAPGIVRKTLDDRVAAGLEPARATVREAMPTMASSAGNPSTEDCQPVDN